jgi:hypothetical protein
MLDQAAKGNKQENGRKQTGQSKNTGGVTKTLKNQVNSTEGTQAGTRHKNQHEKGKTKEAHQHDDGGKPGLYLR